MQRPSLITLLYLLVVYISPGQLQPVFNDTQCSRFGVFEVADNQKVSLTVTGLNQIWSIYWSVSGPSTNGTEIRLGNCKTCYTNCSSTHCTELGDKRFNISRPESRATTLRFVGDVAGIDGSTVKCAQFNNNSIATCNISVLKDYTLSHCEQDELDVTDSEPWKTITCHNLKDHHNISWTITDPNNHSTKLATCQACTECSNACRTSTDDVTVSRTGSVSELRIVGKVGYKNNSKLTCGREDGVLQASCRIRVMLEEQELFLPNSFPAAAVGGGGVVAGVVVIVVVVVVFFKWRSCSKHSKSSPQITGMESEVYENPVVSSESSTAGPYDSLRMSDVGLSSEYSAIGNTNTGSQPQTGQPGTYDSLQMADVGQVSTYSAPDHRDHSTPNYEGGDYEIP
eukprot:GHVL01006923.1.p1 GENE.GHVL01006923.1~~GHVL01006923.1.p1  ORF type:complete len:398 (-),score=8.35 GHVL01006923.1:284-1477(-)